LHSKRFCLPAQLARYRIHGACKLLVFGAPLTSGSLSKNEFFDRLTKEVTVVTSLFFSRIVEEELRFSCDLSDILEKQEGYS